MRIRFFLCLVVFFSFTSIGFSQINNEFLYQGLQTDSAKSGGLFLNINNNNFVRNYEFYNNFQDGYTLFGTQLEPEIVYYANPNLVLSAGVYLRKDFGNKGIYETLPKFTLKYSKNSFSLITGVLEGNVNHRYIEPLYDIERRITRLLEYGTQVKIERKKLFLDAWISWQNMIYKPSAEQEEILGGLSANYKVYDKDLTISVPFQLTAFHKGGQIDTVSRPLQTLLNGAVGLNISKKLNGFFKRAYAENYYLFYKDASSSGLYVFEKGSAAYVNLGFDTRFGTLLGSYFSSNGFNSLVGMPIYQSIGSKINREGFAEKNRQFLFVRYLYQKELVKNLFLDFRLEPYFDFNNPSSNFQLSNSFFLTYKQEFKLFQKEQR